MTNQPSRLVLSFVPIRPCTNQNRMCGLTRLGAPVKGRAKGCHSQLILSPICHDNPFRRLAPHGLSKMRLAGRGHGQQVARHVLVEHRRHACGWSEGRVRVLIGNGARERKQTNKQTRKKGGKEKRKCEYFRTALPAPAPGDGIRSPRPQGRLGSCQRLYQARVPDNW